MGKKCLKIKFYQQFSEKILICLSLETAWKQWWNEVLHTVPARGFPLSNKVLVLQLAWYLAIFEKEYCRRIRIGVFLHFICGNLKAKSQVGELAKKTQSLWYQETKPGIAPQLPALGKFFCLYLPPNSTTVKSTVFLSLSPGFFYETEK